MRFINSFLFIFVFSIPFCLSQEHFKRLPQDICDETLVIFLLDSAEESDNKIVQNYNKNVPKVNEKFMEFKEDYPCSLIIARESEFDNLRDQGYKYYLNFVPWRMHKRGETLAYEVGYGKDARIETPNFDIQIVNMQNDNTYRVAEVPESHAYWTRKILSKLKRGVKRVKSSEGEGGSDRPSVIGMLRQQEYEMFATIWSFEGSVTTVLNDSDEVTSGLLNDRSAMLHTLISWNIQLFALGKNTTITFDPGVGFGIGITGGMAFSFNIPAYLILKTGADARWSNKIETPSAWGIGGGFGFENAFVYTTAPIDNGTGFSATVPSLCFEISKSWDGVGYFRWVTGFPLKGIGEVEYDGGKKQWGSYTGSFWRTGISIVLL